jgi:hypothetical protein
VRSVVQQLVAKVWDQGDSGVQLIWRGAVSGALAQDVAFSLWPNAHRFDPGHRVVLTISSVDLPTFKPDVEPWRANVLLDGTRLDLPVVENNRVSAEGSSRGGGGAFFPAWLLLVVAIGRRRILKGAP